MRPHQRVGITIFLLLVCAAAVVGLSPTGSTNSDVVAVESGGTSSPADAGLKVYLDPETGEVTSATADPSAVIELDAELQNALRYDDEGLTTVRHPDGAESLNLDGRYQEVSVVRMDANGKLIVCTDNLENIEKTLTDTTPITPEVK